MLPESLTPVLAILRPLYQFIYPPACLSCDNSLADDEHKVCQRCWSSIRRISLEDELYKEMSNRLTAGGDISGLASVFHFEKGGTLQSLIHHLKYNEMTAIGMEFGKRVGEKIMLTTGNAGIRGVIPVPLHPTKKRERGYNQSDFIAEGVRRVTGAKVFPSLLRRKKNTVTQTKLNIEERKENMTGAFIVNTHFRSAIANCSFILVDDVITTGATILECARVLKHHGAANIFAASIALADHAADGK